MKPPFRQLLLSAAIAFFLTLTLAVLAQENQKPEPTTPPPATAPTAPASPPPAPDVVAAPATPAAETATAATPVVAVEADKPVETERPLRRLDASTDASGIKDKKSAAVAMERSARKAGFAVPAVISARP
jgi:cytoskeletal protein RodZ